MTIAGNGPAPGGLRIVLPERLKMEGSLASVGNLTSGASAVEAWMAAASSGCAAVEPGHAITHHANIAASSLSMPSPVRMAEVIPNARALLENHSGLIPAA